MGKIAFARLSGLLAAGGALALSGAAAHAAATLVADYEFSGDLSSSVAGAPNLIAVDPGNVGSFNAGGTYNWGGSASPATSQGGFTFDNNSGLLPNNDYSGRPAFRIQYREQRLSADPRLPKPRVGQWVVRGHV